jgi:hypothetical protein
MIRSQTSCHSSSSPRFLEERQCLGREVSLLLLWIDDKMLGIQPNDGKDLSIKDIRTI